MDLRDLRYFETIAELEHIGRATERLHRTQPALTNCIRRLEESFGAPLFEKAGRGIRLTPAGQVLRRLERVLDELAAVLPQPLATTSQPPKPGKPPGKTHNNKAVIVT